MSTLLTFNNDPKIKEDLVNEIKWHQDQDKIIQGVYEDNGKFCAVGCTINSYARKTGKSVQHNDHSLYGEILGIDPIQARIIARLEDKIFEGISFKEAKTFPLEFMEAIPVGVTLDHVFPSMMVFVLKDCIKYASKEEKKAIDNVIKAFERKLSGEEISPDEWHDLRIAAAAAYAAADAAAAAYAAADAAAAAYAAADAAAYAAADAADAAAYAAADAAAYAAAAAKQEAFSRYKKELLRLLKSSK